MWLLPLTYLNLTYFFASFCRETLQQAEESEPQRAAQAWEDLKELKVGEEMVGNPHLRVKPY